MCYELCAFVMYVGDHATVNRDDDDDFTLRVIQVTETCPKGCVSTCCTCIVDDICFEYFQKQVRVRGSKTCCSLVTSFQLACYRRDVAMTEFRRCNGMLCSVTFGSNSHD